MEWLAASNSRCLVLLLLSTLLLPRCMIYVFAADLQMSGRPMGTQARGPDAAEMMNTSSRGQAASVSSEQSTPPRGLGSVYLTPTCGDTCRMCGRRACQVTTPHDDHVCFACEQQTLRQQQRLVESESESCS